MQHELIDRYLEGIEDLRRSIAGMTKEQLVARPVEGQWSTLEVVCHLTDTEGMFVERMKRILVEDRPLLLAADPDRFAPALKYQERDSEIELEVFETLREQMASILRLVPEESLGRFGVHSQSGLCTLEQVLEKCIGHLQHHLKFVQEKRAALGIG